MPSAYRTTRDYAHAGIYERGSRLANSRFQGDPGPTPFAAGTYTPGAAAIKLAHALFTYGSYKRAQQADVAAAAQAQEKSDLEMQALRNRADPEYMSRYQRESLAQRGAPDAPKTATPRAMMTLPDVQAKALGLEPGEYDPEVVNTAETLRGQNMTRDRAAAAARATESRATEKAGGSRRRYTAAAAALRALTAQRSRVGDAAEHAALEGVRGWVREARDPHTDKVRKRALLSDSLGLKPTYGITSKEVPGPVHTRLVKEARLKAERDFDEAHAHEYEAHRRVMDEEAGVLNEFGDPGLDPRIHKIIDTLSPWKAIGGTPPR